MTDKDPDPGSTRKPGSPGKGFVLNKFDKLVKKMDQVCEKTMLDMDAVRKLVKASTDKKEASLLEVQPGEPLKPQQFIDDYKQAAGCRNRWEDMSGTEQFKICNQCGLHVYDFNKMERPEAEALVLKREGIDKPSFHRRADGKFLTSNCPIGLRQKWLTIMVAAAGVVLVSLLTLVAILSPPRPAAVVSTPSQEVSPNYSSPTSSSTSGSHGPVIESIEPPLAGSQDKTAKPAPSAASAPEAAEQGPVSDPRSYQVNNTPWRRSGPIIDNDPIVPDE